MSTSPAPPTRFVVSAEDVGQRLDRRLTARLPDRSRSEIQRWVDAGLVTVAGRPAKAGYKLELGDEVVAQPPPPAEATSLQPSPIPLAVLYEDDDLLVIDKPAGMVVHPAPGHQTDTLVNAVLHHCPDLEGVGGDRGRPGIVHRLDKETSGLIVVAKNDLAHRGLQAQFKARTVYKEYLALVEGRMTPASGKIVAPVGRHPTDRLRQTILAPDPVTGEPRGRPAVTEYHVQGYYTARVHDATGRGHFSLVRAILHTGRTHQIRIHFAWRKHPIVGDALYGYRHLRLPAPRQLLHAHRLRFSLPISGEEREFVAPIPPDFQAVLDQLAGDERA